MVRLIIGILLGLWGLPLFVFSAQNLIGSLNESESNAALMFFFVTGFPALIMLLGSFFLIRSYLKNPPKPAKAEKPGLAADNTTSTPGRYCPKCGSGLSTDAAFCPACGQKVTP
ncbi:MAG: zinc-ribbon domain-containing protein [Dehalococcoides mccartyi]|uniref:zinc-ribbon domain-containing protein n=1 Tax=Dehalococcoides mccartyi TaxID=61435 RepID=UPI0030FABF3A